MGVGRGVVHPNQESVASLQNCSALVRGKADRLLVCSIAVLNYLQTMQPFFLYPWRTALSATVPACRDPLSDLCVVVHDMQGWSRG